MGTDDIKMERGRGPVTALRLAACLLALLLALAALVGAPARANADEPSEAALAKTVDALREALGVSGGQSIYGSELMTAEDSTCQWLAYDFARLGLEADHSGYLDKLAQFVTEKYATPEKIDKLYSTEWNRPNIVIHGLGGDPTSFGTDAAGKPIDLLKDGTYGWTHTNSIVLQGSNGWTYAIEALDAVGIEVPEGGDTVYTEQQMIDELLALQNDKGAWGLTKGTSDTDLTAMAVCALSQHMDQPAVSAAVEKALGFISSAQDYDGTFVFSGGASSETSSQVTMALCALQIDPRTDERFVKDGHSVLDGLLSFQKADGSFAHNADTLGSDKIEVFPTEQALRALIAVAELDQGGDGDVYTADIQLALPGAAVAGANPVPWILGGVAAGLVVVAVLFVVSRGRKRAAARAGR